MANVGIKNTHPAPSASEGDVVIIGAGLAGLFTALKLAPLPVTVISEAPLGDGASSAWAQGGIAAALGEGDTPEDHAADTIRAGAGLVDPAIAQLLAENAGSRIHDLLSYGVPFDRDLEGTLKLSREAAHGKRRIVRVKGDMAGQAIMAALIATARKTPSIRVLEHLSAKSLEISDNRITGVDLWPSGTWGHEEPFRLMAQAVVLATGGIGGLYSVTTNPESSRGEGLAMGAEAGAILADTEFVQFHPTAIDIGAYPAPLATEALRGEGAILVNRSGDRFMVNIHSDAELAPRDIVARAVHDEKQSGRGAFLDCRAAIGDRFADKFPTVYAKCRDAGIDPVRELIPVAPAAHYHMGGILTDANGRSSVDGLWACGEVASTGAHGANRLASNSLLEAIVFAARIAEDIHSVVPLSPLKAYSDCIPSTRADVSKVPRLQNAMDRLRMLMTEHAGVVRNENGLAGLIKEIDALEQVDTKSRTFRNLLTASRSIAAAALERNESRGCHFRSDFPETNPKFARRSNMQLSGATGSRINAIEPNNQERHIESGAAIS
ncbi:L-aspartate oxidase [bacterium MnTg02]|nr:L-aspartate oxidase [bacterium MnTg02]